MTTCSKIFKNTLRNFLLCFPHDLATLTASLNNG